MNSLTAADLKRRGMAAIEEGLRRGPVHLVKRNKPAAVVLSTKEYDALCSRNGINPPGLTAVQWLLKRPHAGTKTKSQLDKLLSGERNSWD
jgi:prevent-host-death family protein